MMAAAAASKPAQGLLDIERVRSDFPTLSRKVNDKPLVYLDSAASALKPQAMIDRITRFYSCHYANIHRGAHTLSMEATADYEAARQTVARFINAPAVEEIVFVRGTTEGINLVAESWGRFEVGEGDEVVITELEHHSNFLPWQKLCEQVGARLRVIPIDDAGQIVLEEAEKLIGERTKLLAIAHVSNVLGTILPVAELTALARARGAKVLIDGAQGVVHMPVDVQALDCDFYVFSGHKLYGPTGIGVLYGKRELLDAMATYQVGGGTIDKVSLEGSTYLDAPLRFEAGTPHVAGALGMATSIEYLEQLGIERVAAHEAALLEQATAAMQQVEGLRLIGTAAQRASVLSFTIDTIHAADVGALLDQQGIAVRVGHHCAQPVMQRYGVSATTRASLGVYNTSADVDALVSGLAKVLELFA